MLVTLRLMMLQHRQRLHGIVMRVLLKLCEHHHRTYSTFAGGTHTRENRMLGRAEAHQQACAPPRTLRGRSFACRRCSFRAARFVAASLCI